MNVNDVKSNVRDRANRMRSNLPANTRRNRRILGASGILPVIVGACLFALRYERVRQALYRMIPQARSYVDRMYGVGVTGRVRHEVEAGGRKVSRTVERTTYGEA